MVKILALVLCHERQAALAAVELALKADGSSKPNVLNVLRRLLDGITTPAPFISPQAPQLFAESQAYVRRYDQLR